MVSLDSIKTNLFTKRGGLNPKRKFTDDEIAFTVNNTLWLDADAPTVMRLFVLLNAYADYPQCECGAKIKKIISYKKGFNRYCSPACANRSPAKLQRSKETNLQKYGATTFLTSVAGKKKIKESLVEKYDVEAATLIPGFNSKAKQTRLARYGDENYNNEAKRRETMQARYGVEYTGQSAELLEKVQQTNRDRYDVPSYSQTAEFQLKKTETNIARYGVKHPAQLPFFKEKTKQTNLEKYQREYPQQQHISDDAMASLSSKEWLLHAHHLCKKSLRRIADELGVDLTTVSLYCKKHEINVIYYASSAPQDQIAEFVTVAHNTRVITNVRTIIPPKEIDIWIPEYKLAIEYNGVYWHRPEVYGGYEQWLAYHQHKVDACSEKGIRLLHLWEGAGNHNELIASAINSDVVENNLLVIYEEIYK